MMQYILIDCDPGHDDALAIMTAYANEEKFEILGISTVGGNQTLEKVTKNAGNLLHFLGAKIPLSKGQPGPLVKALSTGEKAHGGSGMDGPCFGEGTYPVEADRGVQFLYKKIMACPQKVTIVALAPLTNIALLLKVYPEVKEKIGCISMMGGGISHGNCTKLAEFNIYVDPEAAHILFHSGLPIIMSGLDVTEKAAITLSEIKELEKKGPASRLAYELLSFYHESGRQFDFTDSPIHDLCAVEYLLAPEIFHGTREWVDIVTDEGESRGRTYVSSLPKGQEKKVQVLKNVNRKKFVHILVNALEMLDRKCIKREAAGQEPQK